MKQANHGFNIISRSRPRMFLEANDAVLAPSKLQAFNVSGDCYDCFSREATDFLDRPKKKLIKGNEVVFKNPWNNINTVYYLIASNKQ